MYCPTNQTIPQMEPSFEVEKNTCKNMAQAIRAKMKDQYQKTKIKKSDFGKTEP